MFELGTVIDRFREGRTTVPSATHMPQTGPAAAPSPVAPPSAAETEVKEPTPVPFNADFYWPDGHMEFEVPGDQVERGCPTNQSNSASIRPIEMKPVPKEPP
jgi:hypothetical protein